MAADAETLVHGKVYAAFLLANRDYDAKPLMAGMVKLDPSDGVTYKRLETAAELNGVFFWTAKIVVEDQQLPMDAVKASYRLWIDERKARFEKKTKKPLPKDVPCLDSIVSGITFIQRAVSIALISPETAQRCCLLKTPSVARSLSPGALPTLPDDQAGNSLSAQAAPQLRSEVTPAKPILSGEENEIQPGGQQESDDPFAVAVEQIGLDYAAEVTIIDDTTDIEADQHVGKDGEPTLDLDRQVEDALLLADSLPAVDKANPVYSTLVATIRRQQGVHRKQEKMIRSFNQLRRSACSLSRPILLRTSLQDYLQF